MSVNSNENFQNHKRYYIFKITYQYNNNSSDYIILCLYRTDGKHQAIEIKEIVTFNRKDKKKK